MPYKLSKYNYSHEKGDITTFNSFSGGVAIQSSHEFQKMQNFRDYDTIDNDAQEWIKLGFIVDENTDETKMVNYNRFKHVFTSPTNYRILTTSKCNARCFYCYEDFSDIKKIDRRKAKLISEFIINNSKDKNTISISWFGGEPLMNPDAISIITENVANGLKPFDTVVKYDITTNGSLFSDNIIKLAKTKWDIGRVQISLDGMKKTHETRKNYINYANSFKKTINTIERLLCAEIYLSIRLNFDKNNFHDIIELIDYLKIKFGSNKYLDVYAYPLYKSTQCEEMDYLNSDESDIYLTEINNVLLKNSFLKINDIIPKRRKVCCSATSPNSYVIDANGDLYKCSMDMKEKTRSIGNVETGIINQNLFVDWCMPILPSECENCIALPLCQGGCRASRVLNIDDNYCFVKKHSIKYYVQNINSFLS